MCLERCRRVRSPFAPTAPSTPRRAQAQEDYYECLHHKKEFTRRNEVEAHRAAAGKGGGLRGDAGPPRGLLIKKMALLPSSLSLSVRRASVWPRGDLAAPYLRA